MIEFYKGILLIVILMALGACGGGGSSSGPESVPTPDPLPPSGGDVVVSVPINVRVFSSSDGELTIAWSATLDTTYNLYLAAETFSSLNGDVTNYASLSAGAVVLDANTPQRLIGLANDRSYFILLVATENGIDSEPSAEVVGTPRKARDTATLGLNDTGINFTGIVTTPFGNDIDCDASQTVLQDCHTGKANSSSGFDFTKLDAEGEDLADDVTDWRCVRDNVTQLIWEVKTESGLSNQSDSYNWFNQNTLENGGDVGSQDNDGAICHAYDETLSGSFCNTQSFQVRTNQTGLCGLNNWRVPELEELQNIIHYGLGAAGEAMIEQKYFPNTQIAPYWSYTPDVLFPDSAVVLDFQIGNFSSFRKDSNYHIRLVSSGDQ